MRFSMNKNGNIGLIVLIFLILVVVFISVVSNKLHEEMVGVEEPETPPATTAAEPSSDTVTPAASKAKSSASSQKITRKTIVVRGNDFLEHWFYKGDEVIGKQQVNDKGVLNTEGEIPDGKINFVDTYKNTTGDEYYSNGVRDGNSTTYYADGALKETAKYEDGKLVGKVEYYADGKKRFEVDYSDSRDLGNDDIEVGTGKLYYDNGQIKFEWHLTRRDPIGFKKSYNQDGTLRHVVFIDEDNNIVETKEPQKEAAAAAEAAEQRAEQENALTAPPVQP